jgi:hypothetical protein
MSLPHTPWKVLVILSVMAGVLYCSWPLGPLLNPVVARNGLASELAAANQPYSWVFVYGDVVSAALLLIVCAGLVGNFRLRGVNTKLVVGGILLFCLGTIVAALCRVPCVSALQQCPSFVHNPVTLAHAIGSVGSCFALLGAIVGLWWRRRQSVFLRLQAGVYIVSGAVAFILLFVPGREVVLQDLFITICAVCLAALPWSFRCAYPSGSRR